MSDIFKSRAAALEHEARTKMLEAQAKVDTAPLLARIAALERDLQFVERWANHHGAKPHVSAKDALSVIQHYPGITAITNGYADGKLPDTPDPFVKIAALEAELAGVRSGITEEMIFKVGQAIWSASGGDFEPTKDEVRAICRAAIDAMKDKP